MMFSLKLSLLLFRMCPFVWSTHWPEKPFGTRYSPNGVLEAYNTFARHRPLRHVFYPPIPPKM
ncbi:uncharacterized protein BT62DRAFT_935052, partial [Guyanagaster necrorhizus]